MLLKKKGMYLFRYSIWNETKKLLVVFLLSYIFIFADPIKSDYSVVLETIVFYDVLKENNYKVFKLGLNF